MKNLRIFFAWSSAATLAFSLIAGAPAATAYELEPVVSPRIVLGNAVEANSTEYPWMAALLRTGQADPFLAQFCGGSLIDSNTVLTAAHCVDGGTNPEDVQVALGFTSLSAIGSEDRVNVSAIVIHPSYSPSSLRNDVAILRLSRSVDNTPIKLVPAAASQNAGVSVRAIGFGATDWGRTGSSYDYEFEDALQFADLEIKASPSSRSCLNWPSSIYYRAEMICAGGPEIDWGYSDACVGDSGGPLLLKDSEEWTVAGIVSWGPQACGYFESNPGVYSRVSTYRTWIAAALDRVSTFTPARAALGSTVTVNGLFDEEVEAVYFESATEEWAEAELLAQSLTRLSIRVPGSASTGRIKVVTRGGEFLTKTNFNVLYPRPSISSFTSSGNRGDVVTISGSGFLGATAVRFGGFETTEFEVVSNNLITVTIPNWGFTGRITVANPTSSATSRSNLTVMLDPEDAAVFSVSSTRITMATSRSIVFVGQNLNQADSVRFFGGAEVMLEAGNFSEDGTRVTVEVPIGAKTGQVAFLSEDEIIAVTPVSISMNYPRLRITSISTSSAARGSQVTVVGQNLDFVTEVKINQVSAEFEITSATSLTVTIPSEATTGRFAFVTPATTVLTRGNFTVTD